MHVPGNLIFIHELIVAGRRGTEESTLKQTSVLHKGYWCKLICEYVCCVINLWLKPQTALMT